MFNHCKRFQFETCGDFLGMYSSLSILFSEHTVTYRFCYRTSLLQRYSIVLYKSYWGWSFSMALSWWYNWCLLEI